MTIKYYARPAMQLALVLALALGGAGCSTMADLDPTGLLSDDAPPPGPDSQFPADSGQQATADANTTTPDLAALPARPPAPDTAGQAAATKSVTASGAQAQSSADDLRAGTESAAPPPGSADAAASKQALASASANDASSGAAQPQSGPAPLPAAPRPSEALSAGTEPVSAAPSTPATSAMLAPPPGAEPAVPAVPMTSSMTLGARMAMANPTDAQLGFRPSSAPPLNASVAQWVAPPTLAQYRQSAALASSAGTGNPAVPAVAPHHGRMGRQALSGGDVEANIGAMPGSPSGMAAAMNGGLPPTAIVYFPGDGTSLSSAARTQVREAVAAFQAMGGAGNIKVVGHASSRTANMPTERHLEMIFQKSQARADAVAQALIRAGVPADRVQIEAVGDSQPVYYESMPKGEDGNRRAEIFLQG